MSVKTFRLIRNCLDDLESDLSNAYDDIVELERRCEELEINYKGLEDEFKELQSTSGSIGPI